MGKAAPRLPQFRRHGPLPAGRKARAPARSAKVSICCHAGARAASVAGFSRSIESPAWWR